MRHSRTSTKKLLFPFFLSLGFLGSSLGAKAACKLNTRGGPLVFEISKDQNLLLNPSPEFVIDSCETEDLGKAIGIGISPNVISAAGLRYNSFNGLLRPYECTIENSPMAAPDAFAQILDHFRQRNNYLSECIEMEAFSEGGQLGVNSQDPFCQIKKSDGRQSLMAGSICFLTITDQHPIRLRFRINPACSEILQKNLADAPPKEFDSAKAVSTNSSLRPENLYDIPGTLAFYYARPVNTPAKFDILNVILLKELRFLNQAPESLIRLGDSYGNPGIRWPSEVQTDFHPGTISVYSSPYSKAQRIEMSLFVDNRCPQKCLGGECASRCDFAIPLGTIVKLYKKSSSERWKLIDMWYQHGIVPPQWAGQLLLPNHQWESPMIEAGHRYKIELDVTKTDLNYRTSLESLVHRHPILNLDGFSEKALSFQLPLDSIQPVFDNPVQFPTLPNFSSETDFQQLLKQNFQYPWMELAFQTLTEFQETLALYTNWPPFYRYYCSRATLDSDSCRESSSKGSPNKPLLLIATEFTVAMSKPNSQKMPLREFIFRRDSNWVTSYSYSSQTPPEIKCAISKNVSSTLDPLLDLYLMRRP